MRSISERGNTCTIDLLIGFDYFWDIVERDRVVLPSGLLLLSFRLGYIITERYRNHIEHEQIVSSCAISSISSSCSLSDSRKASK